MGWMILGSIPGTGKFVLCNIQTDAAAHQASYSMGSGGSFAGGKTVRAWSWTLNPILCSDYKWVKLNPHTSTARTGAATPLRSAWHLWHFLCANCVTLPQLNRRHQQKLFCKYNKFNYQSLKERWIIWLTNLLSLTNHKVMGVLTSMNLHMYVEFMYTPIHYLVLQNWMAQCCHHMIQGHYFTWPILFFTSWCYYNGCGQPLSQILFIQQGSQLDVTNDIGHI
jgi:hypothetical protein